MEKKKGTRHPIFDDKDVIWNLADGLDVERARFHWPTMEIVNTEKGPIAYFAHEDGWYYYSTHDTGSGLPWWNRASAKFWDTYIVPHIIQPSPFGKEIFDEDDIELAKIFMEEIDEKT